MQILKNQIKKYLKKRGYELRKLHEKNIFSIRQTMEEAYGHIKSVGYYPELVIDVGAANGTPALQAGFPRSYFFWIEALSEFENELNILKKKYTGEFSITAVGSTEKVAEININEDLHGSSLLEPENSGNTKIIKRKILVTTVNSLAKKFDLKRFKKVLLKLDVQGFELDVLEGASEIMEYVDVIVMEVGLFKHYRSAPDLYEVIIAMKNIGYVVYDIVEGLNRPLDFALSYKDIFFVKENGIFRKSHSWK